MAGWVHSEVWARAPALARRPAAPEWLWPVLALVLCGGLTVAAYGSSVGAGFMFDAAIDLPRASDRSWLEVLTSAGASPYFRPVTLLIWKALYIAFGLVIVWAIRRIFPNLHGWVSIVSGISGAAVIAFVSEALDFTKKILEVRKLH